jgi:hypothetical protein
VTLTSREDPSEETEHEADEVVTGLARLRLFGEDDEHPYSRSAVPRYPAAQIAARHLIA